MVKAQVWSGIWTIAIGAMVLSFIWVFVTIKNRWRNSWTTPEDWDYENGEYVIPALLLVCSIIAFVGLLRMIDGVDRIINAAYYALVESIRLGL